MISIAKGSHYVSNYVPKGTLGSKSENQDGDLSHYHVSQLVNQSVEILLI